jgi:hypothetical protein
VVCVFLSRYLAIKLDNDKEKEQKMSINNHFGHDGKRKGGRTICLKINRRNRRANNYKMLTNTMRGRPTSYDCISVLLLLLPSPRLSRYYRQTRM